MLVRLLMHRDGVLYLRLPGYGIAICIQLVIPYKNHDIWSTNPRINIPENL